MPTQIPTKVTTSAVTESHQNPISYFQDCCPLIFQLHLRMYSLQFSIVVCFQFVPQKSLHCLACSLVQYEGNSPGNSSLNVVNAMIINTISDFHKFTHFIQEQSCQPINDSDTQRKVDCDNFRSDPPPQSPAKAFQPKPTKSVTTKAALRQFAVSQTPSSSDDESESVERPLKRFVSPYSL